MRSASEYSYNDGVTVVREGSRSESFFVVLEGAAKATRRGRTVGRFDKGDFFGEIALLDGGPRTATVMADGHLRCLVLPRTEFRQVVTEDPSVGLKILKGAARRLRELERSVAT
jgi:CRP-like cAMP-binding protein